MNKEKLEKLMCLAMLAGQLPAEFGQRLCAAPYKLTPPEATPLMKEYARRLTASAKKPSPLKSVPTRGLPVPVILPPVRVENNAPPIPDPAEPSAPRLSIINRSAVKSYALKVSKEKRAGKFKRVSAEFLNSVEANLEASIRGLVGKTNSDEDVTPDAEADWFINGRTLRVAEDKLNELARQIVLGKVRRHPAIGVTLKT